MSVDRGNTSTSAAGTDPQGAALELPDPASLLIDVNVRRAGLVRSIELSRRSGTSK